MDLERVVEKDDIENVVDIDEYFCQLVASRKTEKTRLDRKSNCVILAFITARNRITLHKHMMTLANNGNRIFYCDTDSILFTSQKKDQNNSPPLPISPAIGDFKYEIPKQSEILSFDAYGRKNFQLQVKHSNGDKRTKIETITKICGMTISPKFVHDKLEENKNAVSFEVPQLRNRFSKENGFHKKTISKFTVKKERNCERIVKNDTICFETEAWGSH